MGPFFMYVARIYRTHVDVSKDIGHGHVGIKMLDEYGSASTLEMRRKGGYQAGMRRSAQPHIWRKERIGLIGACDAE